MVDFFDKSGEKCCPFKFNNTNKNAQKCIKDDCELWIAIEYKNFDGKGKDVVHKACAFKWNVQFSLRQSNVVSEINNNMKLKNLIKVEKPSNIIDLKNLKH